jgi:putative DNA primase/helicase
MHDTTTPIGRVLSQLTGVRKVGGGFEARCPAHDDQRASLTVSVGDDQRVLLHCHAGCTFAAVLESLRLTERDLFARHGHAAAARHIVATYPYVDERSTLLYEAVRYEPKHFHQRRPDGTGGWIWKLEDVRRVLYRLDVLAAGLATRVAGGRPRRVVIVEGEKDVDRVMHSAGDPGRLLVTTNTMGAGKWRDEYARQLLDLACEEVAICPDNDDAGRQHAEAVARSCAAAGLLVRVVELPGLPPKGDVSDWLDAGHTVEELCALVLETPPWSAPAAAPPLPAPALEPATPPAAARPATPDFPNTDSGNAELFAHLYGPRVRYDHTRRRWLLWRGHHWSPDADAEIHRLARDLARHRYVTAWDGAPERRDAAIKWALRTESRAARDSLLALAQAERPIADAGTQWDANPWLLGCPNGVVDLRTGLLRPGIQDDRVTQITPTAYQSAAPCPRWERFIAEVFNDDADLIAFVHRAIGYSLSGDTTEQALFLCHGTGANGKSTLLNLLLRVLGDHACNMPFSAFELHDRNAATNDMASLAGRRFVIASETNDGRRFNEARVKALTGCDPVTARFLFKEFFTFTPVAKFWLSVNHTPTVRDESHGFWRRIRLIPFARTFPVDPALAATLWAEREGILAWAVRGCLAWQQRGLELPDVVVAATHEYRHENDPLGDFLEQACELDQHSVVRAVEMYQHYESWAKSQGFKPAELLTSTMFGRKLGERCTGSGPLRKTRSDRGMVYEGLARKVL